MMTKIDAENHRDGGDTSMYHELTKESLNVTSNWTSFRVLVQGHPRPWVVFVPRRSS